KRLLIQGSEHGVGGKQVRHLGVKVDQSNALDLRVLEDFAYGETVAAPQHQDASWRRYSRKPGMDQRLMIPVLVGGAELQVTIQKQPDVVLEAGQNDVLVTGVAREDDLVGIDVVLGGSRDALCLDNPYTKEANNGDAERAESADRRELLGE